MYFQSIAVSLSTLAIFASAAPVSKRSISSGPVITTNFPDPAYIQDGDTYWAFATEGHGHHVPVASSTNFVDWTLRDYDALPSVGAWSTGQAVWAPHVIKLACGTYVMYYSAQSKATPSIHCIGAATSQNAGGPYSAQDEYLACHASEGGAIDASGFTDFDGKQYVVYKVDGNNIGHGGSCGNTVAPIVRTPILIQEVAAENGYERINGPKQILDRDDANGPLVEAPSLIRVKNPDADNGWMYVLFFSSGCYSANTYNTGYATSISGLLNGGEDYHKASEPLLKTGSHDGKLYAPGGMQVSSGGINVVFHADESTSSGWRQMWSGKIEINGRTVSI